jgi:hypothetical protein
LTTDTDTESIRNASDTHLGGEEAMANASNNAEVGRQGPPAGWPDNFDVSIWLLKEEGQWSALATEFNVAGMGPDQDAALQNLQDNVSAYLVSYMADGATFNDARRRIPYKESVRLWILALVTTALRALTSRKRRQRVEYSGPRGVEHTHRPLRDLALH